MENIEIPACGEIQSQMVGPSLEHFSTEMLEHIKDCPQCLQHYRSLQEKKIPDIVGMAFWVYGIMIFFALFWMFFQEKGLSRLYQPLLKTENWRQDLGIGLGIGLAVILFSRIFYIFFDWAKEMEVRFKGLLGDLNLKDIFWLAFLSGVGEELFFRGAMQYSWGLVLTSLFFGFLHFMPPGSKEEKTENEAMEWKDFSWTLFAIIMGFVFGYSFEYTQNILTPITAHFLINFINLIYIVKS